jgi:hypothetical protein
MENLIMQHNGNYKKGEYFKFIKNKICDFTCK